MSSLEQLHNQVNSLITSLVLAPLSDWLNSEKNVKVTVEDLLDALKLPKSISSSVSSPVLTTALPVTTRPTINVISATVKPKPKSRPPSTESTTSGPSCKYVFKRGDLKGKECGKPVVNGTEFCEQCSNKKTNKPVDAKQTKLGTSATPTESKPVVGFTSPLSKKIEKPKIELRETGQPNTYIDVQTNIVVKKIVDKEKTLYVAVGVQEETGFRTLTEDEKKEALNRNFSLQTSDTKSSLDKKIVSKQPVNSIPDIESDNE